jgi:hypothetical protein
MPGINPSHRTTPFLGLVPDKALELSKRPGVHPAPGFGTPSRLHPLPNVVEVFQYDRRAWSGGLNDLWLMLVEWWKASSLRLTGSV